MSVGLMVLHNLLKAIRQYNRVPNYHSYSYDFYSKIYNVSTVSPFHG